MDFSERLISDIRALLKSDHKEGGITFEAARAQGFQEIKSSQSI